MPPGTYILRYGLPLIVSGFAAAAFVMFYLGAHLPPLVRGPLAALCIVFGGALALMYPVVVMDRHQREINDAIPFFMTHFGVLATSNIPRAEVIRILGGKQEYKALATEMTNVYSLVSNWNRSLPEACRAIARTTPAPLLTDFLDRLAHALETGQDLGVFLRNEQSVVMKEYATLYETSIYNVEAMKDIYMSTMMSGIFLVIFVILMPLMTGEAAGPLVGATLALFVLLEGLFVLLLKFRVPNDRLWHHLPIPTRERNEVRLSLVVTVTVAVVVGVLLERVAGLDIGVTLAIAVAPLAGAGVHATLIERRIRRREENYGAFMRSLGATAAARGGSLRDVLKKLTVHNFGPLTALIHNLYARLTWRLDDRGAWRHFSAESGSNLVDHFNDMFVEGIGSGGKPDVIGDIISENVSRILNLRRGLTSTAGTFRGLLFGFTAGMGFVLFIGLNMVGSLEGVFAGARGIEGVPAAGGGFELDVGSMGGFLLWVMFFHSLIGAVMLKTMDGGTFPAGLGYFATMVWISVIASIASASVMGAVFGSLPPVPDPGGVGGVGV